MRFVHSILAKYVEMPPDSVFTAVGAGFDGIRTDRCPFRIPHLSLLIFFEVSPDECGQSRDLHVKLVDEKGGTVAGTEGVMSVIPQDRPSRMPSQAIRQNCLFNFVNLEIKETGEYRFELTLDGRDRLQEISFYVQAVPSEEAVT
jgi:hypothetical protein